MACTDAAQKRSMTVVLKLCWRRIESSGLKLINQSKCHLRQNEVKYFGHIISKAGVRPDPDKVKAINNNNNNNEL